MFCRLAVIALVTMLSGHALADDRAGYDLASFTLPASWTREETASAVRLTMTTAADRSYCQVNIYKGVAGSGDAPADFAKDWNELVATRFELKAKPAALSRPAIAGWTHHAGQGISRRNGQRTFVTLTTYANRGKTSVSVLTLANHKKCEAVLKRFAAGLTLRAPRAESTTPTSAPTQAPPAATGATSSGFQFTTSNFDEGWVSTVQAEWVLVEKGGVRVYLHFVAPYDNRNFDGTGVMDRDYYWTNYVARQFNVTSTQYRDDGEFVSSMKPKYVEGWATDRVTGEKRFVAMTLEVGPNAAMITLASAPDEQALRKAFPKANDRWASDLAAMSRFNKFAVSAKDLVGTWLSGGSQMTQWYDAGTGAYAGATFAATSATFVFAGNGSYRSIHNAATGAVGSMGTVQQAYKGTYKVSNWSVTATNRYQGKPQMFDAHLQAVRGGRLLFLDDGRGSKYLLVRTAR